RDESMPYVALEAVGAEKPLITTRVGGIPEIFGKHADLLLAPNDAAGLSNAMYAFLNSPTELQKRVSSLAEDVRETFNLERMIDSVLEFYTAADGIIRAGQRPRLS